MPPTEEDIAWFKSTFHPIPKPVLPDDCVEYSLYIFPTTALTDDAIRPSLREVQKAAGQLQKEYLKNYIWQRQPFGLEIVKEDGLSLLRGRAEYGDSVEDEWIIVWLLKELSTKFKCLFVKVSDSDGEFLLVEAAGTLPEWLEPDVAENRVWIHDGGLTIIKPTHEGKSKQKTSQEKLTLEDARKLLISSSKRLLRSATIEAEAFYRLRNYPQQIMETIHHAMVTLPRNAAFLLHQKPSYISPAVEAFYLRDPISLKPLQSSSINDLIFLPSDLVTISMAIPRVAYAQLKSQDFPPPNAWSKKLPSKTEEKAYNQAVTGMKISCGFEMLLSDPHYQDRPAVREMRMVLDDVKTGDETLPSDGDIATWPHDEDDEKWLDISFEDLDGELSGRGKGTSGKTGDFGDKATQENLQRIVAQFEKFLNDDSAGPDGAGLFNESDSDDEELDSDDDVVSNGEDKDISFDDEQLSKMMREMMGMPSDMTPRTDPSNKSLTKQGRVEELDSDDPDAEEIEALSRQMEAELNESDALNLDPIPRKIAATKQVGKGKGKVSKGEPEEEGSDDGEENDVDINLARNLLESLRSQGGTAGPGGNLMGLMGFGMPRDEDDAYRRRPGK